MVEETFIDPTAIAPPRRHRYAVVSGSLGVGNLGDDALLAAFLAQHGHSYHGVAVLVSGGGREFPGLWMLDPRERQALPDSLSVLKLAAMGGRLGMWRSLPDRFRAKLALQSLADGADIDYVWLGGLLGHAQHINLRLRELNWASTFVARVVYYFGDAEVRPDAHNAARELAAKLRDQPTFVAVRSTVAAEELAKFGFPSAQVGTDAVLYQYSDTQYRRARSSGARFVISPCNYKVELYKPLWMGVARAAARRGIPVEWVSLSDPDDLTLCNELHARLTAEQRAGQLLGSSTVTKSRGALEALRSATAAVATRFHAHIFSVCFGAPTISVSYARKTKRLFDDLGLADWRLNPEAPADLSQYESLLDRALDQNFVPPELKLAELRSSHQRVVSAFASSLDAA